RRRVPHMDDLWRAVDVRPGVAQPLSSHQPSVSYVKPVRKLDSTRFARNDGELGGIDRSPRDSLGREAAFSERAQEAFLRARYVRRQISVPRTAGRTHAG